MAETRDQPKLSRVARITAELLRVPLRLPDPDTAEAIERAAEAIHAGVRAFAPELEAPANITGLALVNPRTTFDRIAEMFRVRVRAVPWLDDDTLALWVEFAATILVATTLRYIERALMLAHELAHERRRRAPHREVLYLTICMLLPRSLIEEIPEGRPITGKALQDVCPWPVSLELCEARAELLRRARAA